MIGAARQFDAYWDRCRDGAGSAESEGGHPAARTAVRYLPHVAVVTTMVAVVPVAVAEALRSSGVIMSGWLSVAVAVSLSFAASLVGSLYWRERRGAGELLFSELLLWGWLRRCLEDWRVARASGLLAAENLSRGADQQPLTFAGRRRLLSELAAALEGQDPYLRGHSRRVARHAARIAAQMGLSSEEVATVRAAALIHDVGKFRMPPSILTKAGRLTDAEFELVKHHPVDGAEMAVALADPGITVIVRHHHERLDGSGYPDGLSGDDIPVGARIVAVADTFDAVTSTRAYRSAALHRQAIGILRDDAGSRLDPAAVHAFLEYYSGNRLALIWAVTTSMVRRGISWLTGDGAVAGPMSSGKFTATVFATVAFGGAVAGTPVAALNVVTLADPSGAVPSNRALFGGSMHSGPPSVGSARLRAPSHAGSLAASGWVGPLSGRGNAWLTVAGLGQVLGTGSTSVGARAGSMPGSTTGYQAPGRAKPGTAAGFATQSPSGANGAPSGPDALATQPSSAGQPQYSGRPRPGGHRRAAALGGGDGNAGAGSGGGSRGGGRGNGHRKSGGTGNTDGPGNGGSNGNAYGYGNSAGPGNAGVHGATGPAGTAPGLGGTAPGLGGVAPGQTGAAPGLAGSAPGHAGTAPGLAGTAPGLAGTSPGQAEGSQGGDGRGKGRGRG